MSAPTLQRGAPPAPILFARRIALVESVLALVGLTLGLWLALSAHVEDTRAARVGNPNEFAGLGESVGGWLAGLSFALVLFVGLPALLLRGRSAPVGWVILAVAQSLLGAVFLYYLVMSRTTAVPIPAGCAAVCAAVVIALLRPASRRWAFPASGQG